MICSHCGSDGHAAENCTVKQATARILDNHKPRGMTTGHPCPDCGRDGCWHWADGSTKFQCECGRKVPVWVCVCCGEALERAAQVAAKDDDAGYDMTMCGGCNVSQRTVAGQEA